MGKKETNEQKGFAAKQAASAVILAGERTRSDLVAVGSSMVIHGESDRVALSSLTNVEVALFGEGEGCLEGVVADVYGIRQNSGLDNTGVDLILTISQRFLKQAEVVQVHFSFRELMVQIKSSEVHFKKHWGGNGSSAGWKKEGKITLEGEWAHEMIVSDFMLQVMALANGLRDREVGQKMLAMFPVGAVEILRRNILTLEQLHGEFYVWLSGVEKLANFRKLSERLGFEG